MTIQWFTIIKRNNLKITFGGLAQLARALRWQCRGHRFESDILHFYQVTHAVITHYFHFQLSSVFYDFKKLNILLFIFPKASSYAKLSVFCEMIFFNKEGIKISGAGFCDG